MNNQFPDGIIHYKDVSKSYIDALIDELGLRLNADTGELTNLVTELLKTNEKAIEQYKNGNEKALNAIVGQVMKVTKQYDGSKIIEAIKQALW